MIKHRVSKLLDEIERLKNAPPALDLSTRHDILNAYIMINGKPFQLIQAQVTANTADAFYDYGGVITYASPYNIGTIIDLKLRG